MSSDLIGVSAVAIHGAGGNSAKRLGQSGAVARGPHLGLRQTNPSDSTRLLGRVRDCASRLVAQVSANAAERVLIPPAAKPIVTLLVVGLILLNALAVTSLTNERDSRALDLLLVTDLSPKEIVFGKLVGAFYNAKEMILLPIALCIYLWFASAITTENLAFLLCGIAVMNAFAAMLGLHMGMNYANSRTAIATSIGTMLFLFSASRRACESCSRSAIRSTTSSRRSSALSLAEASGCTSL